MTNLPTPAEFKRLEAAKLAKRKRKTREFEAEEKKRIDEEIARDVGIIMGYVERTLQAGESKFFGDYRRQEAIDKVNKSIKKSGWSVRQGRSKVNTWPGVREFPFYIEPL